MSQTYEVNARLWDGVQKLRVTVSDEGHALSVEAIEADADRKRVLANISTMLGRGVSPIELSVRADDFKEIVNTLRATENQHNAPRRAAALAEHEKRNKNGQ
ncbi:hypothetical protein [Acidocella aminolytica]|uniref:Uncharacterized protein n=1 Tax=Acidocella aminolytica 101 = DSM 11237 TaxID=1120923 RepID=A0A0D6PF26_9PROT|nr:hypothetical protein [Acidocella aminolytica]GAN79808.1 hypothetical protein Aam_030_041 [Acidocella aminolytica 101 = DSM 11237]GBQ34320.1 hypothetical protein AA11237_0714 [Acidocella aminolytica 101 = DSM 11237]SHF36490.1 hypothetical protein SAMN02746095_02990 [Acidocella aminolytica 101 = DSM 11237]